MPKPSSPVMENVPTCDVCGSTSQTVLFQAQDLNQHKPGNFNIVRCNHCGLVFVNPRPTVGSIGQYYPSDYWRPLPNKAEIRQAYGEIYDELAKLPVGRMLDVGTGGAYFLSLFDNWQREGTELSPQAAKRSSEAYGFPIYPGLLEDVYSTGKLKDGSFDLITLNHVIEHLYAPQQTVKLLYKLLKPGGKLMISTPNFGSITERISGPLWYHLDPPRHLYLFTPKLLRRLLEQNGFKVNKITFAHADHNQAGYTVSFQRYVDTKPRPVRKLANKFIHMSQKLMPRLMSAAGQADVMAVFATKV